MNNRTIKFMFTVRPTEKFVVQKLFKDIFPDGAIDSDNLAMANTIWCYVYIDHRDEATLWLRYNEIGKEAHAIPLAMELAHYTDMVGIPLLVIPLRDRAADV